MARRRAIVITMQSLQRFAENLCGHILHVGFIAGREVEVWSSKPMALIFAWVKGLDRHDKMKLSLLKLLS